MRLISHESVIQNVNPNRVLDINPSVGPNNLGSLVETQGLISTEDGEINSYL